jgi:hypothetical protein
MTIFLRLTLWLAVGAFLALLPPAEAATKAVVDNRLPAPSRDDPCNYNP